MPRNFKRTSLAVNAEADAVCKLLDGGYLDLYNGTQPATADSPLNGQVRLARLTFGSPAFAPSFNGVAKSMSIRSDEEAEANGTATWFRAVSADGHNVFDGSVGTTDADLMLNTVNVKQNAIVTISAMTYTATKDVRLQRDVN